MKYCPYCGVRLPDDTASFCGECGKALPKSGNVNRDVKLKKTVSQAHPFIEWLRKSPYLLGRLQLYLPPAF